MGHRVIGCDNFNDYYTPQLKHDRVAELLTPRGIACHHTELSDAAQVASLFETHQPSHVVHLAAQAGVRYSLENPAAYIQSNLVAFSHMLEACRRHQVQHMLYASSSSVYGANAKVPFSESDQTDAPVSLYAATKKANELMAYSYSHLYGLPMTGLRFFTVYGPWGRPDMAYFSFTRKIMNGEPIPVFAKGELRRDFTYIDDIVEGVVRVIDRPATADAGFDAKHPDPARSRAPFRVFNIGNQGPVELMQFVGAIEKALGPRAQQQMRPMQPGDVPATYADVSELTGWTGFKPGTSIEVGVARFVEWYRSYFKV
jgi:UDP-glucuronate 4-epimerase